MPQTLFAKIQHVGTVKLSGGMLRIDVKIIQAAIARSDVSRLTGDLARVTVWDMTPVWSGSGEPTEAGQAWINASGRAVMYEHTRQAIYLPALTYPGSDRRLTEVCEHFHNHLGTNHPGIRAGSTPGGAGMKKVPVFAGLMISSLVMRRPTFRNNPIS